jgi:hypothetical protein
MKTSLKNVNSFDWQKQFEERAQRSADWLEDITKKVPLNQRRNIVKRIQEGMEEAIFHRDIVYGATQIRDSLRFALWAYIPQTPEQNSRAKRKIDDFSIWAATQAAVHKSDIQETFEKIIPEDAPQKESIAAIAGQALGSCLHEYGL